MLSHATGNGKHCLKDRGPDLYETPPEALRALMAVEGLPLRIWEPACGLGAIVSPLRAAGHEVVATDLNEWGCPDSQSGIDFLMERRAPDGCECILTNPPFKLAGQFASHALTLAPVVILLLRLAFLEGTGRTKLLEHSGLARIHVFRNRLRRMHRHGWEGPKSEASAVAFAWFVWSRAHRGPALLDRISWAP